MDDGDEDAKRREREEAEQRERAAIEAVLAGAKSDNVDAQTKQKPSTSVVKKRARKRKVPAHDDENDVFQSPPDSPSHQNFSIERSEWPDEPDAGGDQKISKSHQNSISEIVEQVVARERMRAAATSTAGSSNSAPSTSKQVHPDEHESETVDGTVEATNSDDGESDVFEENDEEISARRDLKEVTLISANGNALTPLWLSGQNPDRVTLVPTTMLTSEDALRTVLTPALFEAVSAAGRDRLTKLLPVGSTPNSLTSHLESALSSENVRFGNAIGTFWKQLCAGRFSHSRSDISPDTQQHQTRGVSLERKRVAAKRLFLANRLAESAYEKQFAAIRSMADTCSIPARGAVFGVDLDDRQLAAQQRQVRVAQRAMRRTELLLRDVAKRARVSTTPSLSDFLDDLEPGRADAQAVSRAATSTILDTSTSDLDLNQPLFVDSLRQLIADYKNLKKAQPNAHVFDYSGIDMEEVFRRYGQNCVHDKLMEAIQSANLELGLPESAVHGKNAGQWLRGKALERLKRAPHGSL